MEQVRSAMNVWLVTDLFPASRHRRFEDKLEKQQYYQHPNRQARVSHTKTRIATLTDLGIYVACIKSCLNENDTS